MNQGNGDNGGQTNGRKMSDFYEHIEKIGEGAYGVVSKGRNRQTLAVVAIKKIKIDFATEEGIPAIALREISLLKMLDCPNVIRLLDVFPDNYRLYLIFEYLAQDLKVYIDCMGPEGMDPRILNSFSWQMLNGLAHCHARMILHRDLKPQNILIDARGNLKLADFGLARPFKTPIHKYTHEVVTLWYRAPEILLGSDHYSTAVDIWAAACIIAEMSNLTAMFPGTAEIDQLFLIFKLLGTPTDGTWPGVQTLVYYQPVFPRFPPRDFAQALPFLNSQGVDLLQHLLRYEPGKRLTAKEALEHPFFFEEEEIPRPIDL